MELISKNWTEKISQERFGLSLSEEETEQFLKIIGVQKDSYSLDFYFLKSLINATLTTLPFQNLNMLTRPAKSPSIQEIKEDMLKGRGGPCGTMNPFIGALLYRLGFDVHLVSGTMQQPDCHLALLVKQENKSYYVDCGDGRPYFEPMQIDLYKEFYSPSWNWRVIPLKSEGKFKIQYLSKEKKWEDDCLVNPEPKPFHFFEKMIHSHYTTAEYGPFLRSFRLIYYPDKKIKALRDLLFISEENGELKRRELKEKSEFYQILQQEFSIVSLPIEEAIQVLIRRNVESFVSVFS